MYVLAISVLNNSATPALFVSILSKLEQPIRFSLSHKRPCHGSSVCHRAFWFLECFPASLDDAGPSLAKSALCLSLYIYLERSVLVFTEYGDCSICED